MGEVGGIGGITLAQSGANKTGDKVALCHATTHIAFQQRVLQSVAVHDDVVEVWGWGGWMR